MEYHVATAISFIDLKETAIYFDRVIPANLMMEYLWATSLDKNKGKIKNPQVIMEEFFDEIRAAGVLNEILPPQIASAATFWEEIGKLNGDFADLMLKAMILKHGFDQRIKGLSAEQYAEIETQTARTFTRFVSNFHLARAAVDAPELSFTPDNSEKSEVSATLASLQLIDARKKSWREIVELRHDSVAREKLRNLRLFAYQNYAGREKAYIEDDILQKISNYETVAKEWGFETKQGAISILLNSKTLAAASTASFVSVLFGEPTAALAALVGGVGIEFGRTALYLNKQIFSLRKALSENPVSFIAYAKSGSMSAIDCK